MAKLQKSRYSQDVQVLEFAFNHDDTMVNQAGAEVDFGLTNTAATVFAIAKLPAGATVIGGGVAREEAFDAATYTIKIGDVAADDRYLAAADLKAVGNTALVVTGQRTTSPTDVIMTVTAADVCTTGSGTVRLLYTVANRGWEVTAGS